MVTAIWPTTRTSRAVHRRPPAPRPDVSPLRSHTRLARVDLSAGASPARMPVKTSAAGGERQHARVEPQIQRDWHGNRQLECREEPCQPHGEQHADTRSQDSEDEAFGEELPHETSSGGADGQPNRNLALPRGGARQQHPGHVGAGDDEHQPDRHHRPGHDPREHAIGFGMQPRLRGGPQTDPAILVGLRVLSAEARGDDIDPGVRLLDRYTGSEPALDEEPALAAAIDTRGSCGRGDGLIDAHGLDLFRESHGHPDLWRQKRHHAGKAIVEHADDRELLTANAEALAERAGVRAKLALPVAIRQNHRSRCRRGVVFGLKRSPQARRDSQRREVVAGDHFAEHQARAVADADAGKHRRVAGEVGEDVLALLIVEDVGERVARIGITVGAARVDVHEAGWVPHRERPQEQGVDDRKNRGIEPDPRSQRQNRNEREPGAFAEPAQRYSACRGAGHRA